MKNSQFGRIAIAEQQVDRDQLRRAEKLQTQQQEAGQSRPIGDLLAEIGALDAPAVTAVRQRIRQELAEDMTWLPAALRECELGRLACYRGLLTMDELKAALWTQALRVSEGVEDSIGELLVRSGYLTRHQLIQSQIYEVLFCERCQTLFKVNGFEQGMRIKCTSCPVMLKPPPHDLKLISSSRDLFIDSHGLQQRTWFGELAVRHQFATAEQVAQATDHWARGLGDRALGEIMIDLGIINATQSAEIDNHVEGAQRAALDAQRERYTGLRFGEIAVKMSLITSQMLLEALKVQTDQGGPIGERLATSGYLTRNQGLRVLEMQNKSVLRCDGCHKQYNVSSRERGLFPSCPACKSRMSRVDSADSLQFDGELSGGQA